MNEVIYGAGGHARELAFQLAMQNRTVSAFIDDFNFDRQIGEIPVLSYSDAISRFSNDTWHMAIGNISARRMLLQKMTDDGLKIGGFISNRSLIAPSANIHSTAQIFANAVISDSCEIGESAIISYGVILEHDVRIGKNSFICPNCSIAGAVSIGSYVWLGIGSVVREGSPSRPVAIGDNAFVGAASCVLNSVSNGDVVYGVPARSRTL